MTEFAIALAIALATNAVVYHLGRRAGRRDISPVHDIGVAIIRRMYRLDVGDSATLDLHHREPGVYGVSERGGDE